jgi:DNA-binding MarR family transcriptional regulator
MRGHTICLFAPGLARKIRVYTHCPFKGALMLDYDFENSVGYWVFATAHALACAMNDELAAHGITARQWEVLACISHDGELSQSELAERMHIEAPTLVGVLDRMERDGWILRVTDENDRRRKLIRPSERAEEQWGRMVACGLAVRARATQHLDEDALRKLRETLKTMCENMHALVNGRVARKSVDGVNGAPAEMPATAQLR